MPSHQAGFFCPSCRQNRLFTQQTTNHVLHLLATVFLCGLWLPIWILVALTDNKPFLCTQCGYAQTAVNLTNPIHCPACNANVRHEDSRCGTCGKALSGSAEFGNWMSKNNNAWKVGSAVCLLMIAVIGIMALQSYQKRIVTPVNSAALQTVSSSANEAKSQNSGITNNNSVDVEKRRLFAQMIESSMMEKGFVVVISLEGKDETTMRVKFPEIQHDNNSIKTFAGNASYLAAYKEVGFKKIIFVDMRGKVFNIKL